MQHKLESKYSTQPNSKHKRLQNEVNYITQANVKATVITSIQSQQHDFQKVTLHHDAKNMRCMSFC